MLKSISSFFFLAFALYAFILNGCEKDGLTMPGREIISTDSLSLSAIESNLTSIKLRLITSSQNPGQRKVKLFRLGDDSASAAILVLEYPLLIKKDTIILDDDHGKGLEMDHHYQYRAMIFDSLNGQRYSVQEVGARTLSLTTYNHIWSKSTKVRGYSREILFGRQKNFDIESVWTGRL